MKTELRHLGIVRGRCSVCGYIDKQCGPRRRYVCVMCQDDEYGLRWKGWNDKMESVYYRLLRDVGIAMNAIPGYWLDDNTKSKIVELIRRNWNEPQNEEMWKAQVEIVLSSVPTQASV